jgi:hypothetical protein
MNHGPNEIDQYYEFYWHASKLNPQMFTRRKGRSRNDRQIGERGWIVKFDVPVSSQHRSDNFRTARVVGGFVAGES